MIINIGGVWFKLGGEGGMGVCVVIYISGGVDEFIVWYVILLLLWELLVLFINSYWVIVVMSLCLGICIR